MAAEVEPTKIGTRSGNVAGSEKLLYKTCQLSFSRFEIMYIQREHLVDVR